MAEKYFELLKNGKVRCCDFTDETLSEVIQFAGESINQLPGSLQGELMYRKLIPLNLREASDVGGFRQLLSPFSDPGPVGGLSLAAVAGMRAMLNKI